MEMRTLGRTGVQVSPLTLGAMMFGAWGNPDHDESVKIIHAALDAGINVIDTADVYAAGESEEIVGKALQGRREHVVLATKAHGPMGEDPNQRGNSRRWLVREVEASLRRLQTDHIDLYQIHRPSPDTEVEETLDALTDLQRAGKILYFGSSTYPASQIVQAQWAAERRHSGRFVTEQPPYSLLVRGIEAEVLPVCQQYGMGVLPWSPLAGGWLSGRWRLGQDAPASTRSGRIPGRYDLSLPGQPGQARGRRRAGGARRGGGDDAGAPGHRVRAAAPGRDERDHRAADDGAPDVAARRGGPGADGRRAGPDRRDRAAGDDLLVGGRGVLAAVADGEGAAAAVGGGVAVGRGRSRV